MNLKNIVTPLLVFSLVLFSQMVQSAEPKHFSKIMVVIFENMSYAEIKNAPTFKKLVEYSGNQFDEKGKLHKPSQIDARQDDHGNGYALFSRYFNNHDGGGVPTRPSQPNYIAMTSGGTQNIHDNANHDIDADHIGAALNDAGVTWKIYAEDLPSPNYTSSTCFKGASYPSYNGYQRKHEPFISYKNVQNDFEQCKKIVNANTFYTDLDTNLASVSFYIPNQINDGHNGSLQERIINANAFLSKMLGTDPKTGEPLANADKAPFKRFMSNGGLLVIAFDEPSVTGNPDNSMYMLLAGKMIKSGAYPDHQGKNAPRCYPDVSQQTIYPKDLNGDYAPFNCNHYNLIKLIESNWNLRSLYPEHSSSGYKYAYSLDNKIKYLWK